MKDWKAEVKYKTKTSAQEDKFIFEQAEKKLKELLVSSDLVVSRSTTIITLVVGILVGLISFSINRYTTNKSLDDFINMSIIGTIYLFAIIWYISKNIKGTDHSSIGAAPKIIFTKDFFEFTDDIALREKLLIWSQIENYQDSLDINRPINEQKWKRFNRAMNLVMSVPAVFLATFYIIRYFRLRNWF